MAFQIDERITSSCLFLANWPLSTVMLKNHAHYPWLVLVPRVENTTEIYMLSKPNQYRLISEVEKASMIMRHFFDSDKLNVAALGNIVTQLHVHVVARSVRDPLWPQGIWQEACQDIPYQEHDLSILVEQLQPLIANAFDRKK